MIERRGNILVVRGGAIGDFILTLPVLAALRNTFPQVRLAVLGYPHIAQLASAAGLVDEVRSIDSRPLAGFFAAGGKLDPSLSEFFGGFNLVVSYLYDPDRIFEENVWRCSPAQFIAGPHRPDESAGIHATQTFLKPLERLAIYDPDPRPRIELAEASVTKRSGRWLAVHPGSGSESKNWPAERWEELLRGLAQDDRVHLVLIGGEAEGDKIQKLARFWPAQRLELAMNLPLVELAKVLRGCAMFLGHDSGITHLAAALGVPGLALWGPSNASVWHPHSDALRVYKPAAGLARLSAEEVGKAFRELWDAVPAAQHLKG